MTTPAGRTWKRRAASAALLLAGIIALVAMGPQFIVFIPILVAAWLLARFGLVPRAVHPRETHVRILGGPADGALRFADVRIHADRGDERGTEELLLLLARALTRRAGAEPLVVLSAADPSAAGEPPSFTSLANEPRRLLDTPGLTLVWLPGAASRAGEAALPDATLRWREAWPAAVAAQSGQSAAIALEARRESGADAGAAIGLLGEPALLGDALADVARECRDAGHASAWTSGWVRDIEREAARAHAARRRKTRARDHAS